MLDGKLYAIGGHVDQNRKPHDECFVFDIASNRWTKIASLPRACGAIACVGFNGKLHAIGGATGDTNVTKKSVDWHLVYDPKSDRWDTLAPMPTGRDHTGTLVVGKPMHPCSRRVTDWARL